jgi:hypothetical protein
MWSRRRTVASLCVAVLAGLLTGCTGSSPSDGPEGGASQTPEPAEIPSAAGDLRMDLEALFGWHGHLIAEAVRGTKPAQEASRAAAEDSAQALADALAEAAAGTAGASEPGEDLVDAWSAVTAALAGDGGGKAPSADSAIDDAIDDAVAATLAVVGDGPDEEGLEDLLRSPMSTLQRHGEAIADKEREEAYELAREAYAQMVTAGGAIAAAVTEADPDTYPGPRNSGALELRSALRQLLGEHALLTVTVTRRGAKAGPDFSAAAAALNGNTTDLSDALRSVYETPVAAFETQWRDRLALIAEYAAALGDKRDKAANEARAEVERSAAAVGQALAQATEDAVKPAKAASAMRALDGALLDQIDAFVEADLEQADTAAQEAFRRGLKIGDLIAVRIARQQPKQFPAT